MGFVYKRVARCGLQLHRGRALREIPMEGTETDLHHLAWLRRQLPALSLYSSRKIQLEQTDHQHAGSAFQHRLSHLNDTPHQQLRSASRSMASRAGKQWTDVERSAPHRINAAWGGSAHLSPVLLFIITSLLGRGAFPIHILAPRSRACLLPLFLLSSQTIVFNQLLDTIDQEP